MSRLPLPDLLAQRLELLKPSGDQWTARCPAHNDGRPSLGVKATDDGKVLFKCYAGCDPEAIIGSLGLTWEHLRPETNETRTDDKWTPHGPAAAIYDYRDETGKLLFQVCRTADKQFPQRRPDESRKSGWAWNLGDTRRVLFRLPQIIEGVTAGRPVFVCEGEKDVLSLEKIGQLATCNPGGAGKWRDEYAPFLRDAYVTICADADTPGQAHARRVAASLGGIARAVRTVEAAQGHKDVTEHLDAGLPLAELRVTHTGEQATEPDLAPDVHELLATTDPPEEWVVPGFLERGERLILTGFEGLGKSMLVRQIAVTCAAGLHPFTFATVPPVKVLFLDFENSARQSRKRLRPMRDQAEHDGRPVPDGGLRIVLRPEGIDLENPDDAAWLLERVTLHQPDLLVIGPMYRMHTGKLEDDAVSRRIVGAIDSARLAVNCAVVIEAHSPHASGLASRSPRPIGSSLLLRWPEYGYGLRPNDHTDAKTRSPVDLVEWRGPRDERDWPRALQHGGDSRWAWEEAYELTVAIRSAS